MFEQIRPFACPSCKEVIGGRMTECKFCHAPVDEGIAEMLAATQAKVNQACSDASYLKAAAIGMWVLLAICFVPLVPLVGWCFEVTFVVVLVLLIRWQLKFNDLNTGDADFVRARNTKNLAFVLWVAAIPVGFVILPSVMEAITPTLFDG
ncbi:MAG TPA: hypothetical protein VEY11_10650 [Pyrinomonadaceae bacterium]|nr:hypothetical protein [Pyrinomonadaceae bacterium]